MIQAIRWSIYQCMDTQGRALIKANQGNEVVAIQFLSNEADWMSTLHSFFDRGLFPLDDDDDDDVLDDPS